jgi:adenosyl cobinamide kinase/adenosyl cobinamide phosphate guanylyltransferase
VITLVIGGTRSGKSEVAEQIVARLANDVTVVAPGVATDPDMAARIEAHRSRRPWQWSTVECGANLVDALSDATGVVLLDSLGSWIAASDGFDVDADVLLETLAARDGDTVIVTEEVGLSVHPPSAAGRAFGDTLGALNGNVAAIADDVLLVVAGRYVRLERMGD